MRVRKVTRADLPAFANVVAKAMWDDEVIAYVSPYRNQYPSSYIGHCLHRAKVRWYRGEVLLLAVTDASDLDWAGQEEVMGYASYSTTVKSVQKPCPAGWLGNNFERKALDWYGAYVEFFKLNWSADPVAERQFRWAAGEPHFAAYFESLPLRHKQVKGDQHWELELLGTHPEYRRRGVGKMLLQWGFEKATRDQVPLVLLASLTGEKLYLHTGFREVKRRAMLLDELEKGMMTEKSKKLPAGTELISWACMAWEPPDYRDDEEELITVQ